MAEKQENKEYKFPVEYRLRGNGLLQSMVDKKLRPPEPSFDTPPLPFKWETPPDRLGHQLSAFLDGFGDCKVNPITARKTETNRLILKKKAQIDIDEHTGKDIRPMPTWTGYPVVQVFSIRFKRKRRINHENSVNPGDVYGTIELHDVSSVIPSYLYNRQPGDLKPIGPYGTLSLTSSLCFDPDFFEKVILNLKDKDCYLFPRKENEQLISWNPRSGKYGVPISQRFKSKFCFATMHFIVFRRAVRAKVTVELVKKDGLDRTDRVHGSVVARYSNHDYSTVEKKKYWQNVLFYCPENNYMKVNHGKLIPLSRCVVAVPTNSSLVIEAELWDYDKLISDGEIATGTVEFWPRCEGETVHEINGANGLLRVTVAWRSTGCW